MLRWLTYGGITKGPARHAGSRLRELDDETRSFNNALVEAATLRGVMHILGTLAAHGL